MYVITVLDYYLKLKSVLNISYGATLSTGISYHNCDIFVLTQNKNINLLFILYVESG